MWSCSLIVMKMWDTWWLACGFIVWKLLHWVHLKVCSLCECLVVWSTKLGCVIMHAVKYLVLLLHSRSAHSLYATQTKAIEHKGWTQSERHKTRGIFVQKLLMAQQTIFPLCKRNKFTPHTLTISTEILKKIIMAASHEGKPQLVTPQTPCPLNSLAQTHTIKKP